MVLESIIFTHPCSTVMVIESFTVYVLLSTIRVPPFSMTMEEYWPIVTLCNAKLAPLAMVSDDEWPMSISLASPWSFPRNHSSPTNEMTPLSYSNWRLLAGTPFQKARMSSEVDDVSKRVLHPFVRMSNCGLSSIPIVCSCFPALVSKGFCSIETCNSIRMKRTTTHRLVSYQKYRVSTLSRRFCLHIKCKFWPQKNMMYACLSQCVQCRDSTLVTVASLQSTFACIGVLRGICPSALLFDRFGWFVFHTKFQTL